MKLYFLAFICSFISFISLAKDKEKEAILNLLEDQRKAWNKGDIEAYMYGYWQSDSLLFVGKNGPNYGWQTTLNNYRKSYPDQSAMGYLSFDILKVEFMGKRNAFVLGRWHLKREKDEPQGYFTLLLKKINENWKIVADHSS